MKRINYIFVIALVILSCSICYAEDKGFSNKNDVKEFCEIVVSNFKDENFNNMFAILRSQWNLSDSELNNLHLTTVKQLDLLKTRYGHSLDYKFMSEEEIEDVGIRYIYVIKYENHILRCTFIFYKPTTKWYLNTFKWDDRLELLFSN
jgi:hypothetical protein